MLLIVGCAAPMTWVLSSRMERSEGGTAASEDAVPDADVLRVLVRPDRAVSLAGRAGLLLDQEIAHGIAGLVGKRVELFFEHAEARMVDRLVSGEVDLVAHLPITPERRDRVSFSTPYGLASGTRAAAVAVRPDDTDLRRVANEFLISHALLGPRDATRDGDLEEIMKRGTLRILTERGPASYFVHGGEQRGFEYELMRRFAARHELRLEVVVPPARTDLIPWLLQGRGDVVAAGLTVTSARTQQVAFTRPYQNAQEVIVVRSGASVADLDDLRGRTVYVRAGTAHHETLRELRQFDDDFKIILVPESFSSRDVLDRVEDGTWDATVCDSYVLEMERTAGRRLEAAFPIKAVRHAWATRPENPELRSALDEFIRAEYRGLHFNTIRDRYSEPSGSLVAADDEYRSDVSGRISRWDDLIRRYAGHYGLDWRLVAAQMYEESRFDETQVSPAGAAGLMQIMPATARELGLETREDPEGSIRAGTEYLSGLIRRFDPDLPLATRIRFALASYNAGRGHVQDARDLAARLGWSPDEWYGSVERALLLLQLPEYYRGTRYGFCRANETVRYVQEIDRRYRAYVNHVPGALTSLETSREQPLGS